MIGDTKLKVMAEEDYVALQKADNREQKTEGKHLTSDICHLTSEVMKEIILPEIERDINSGENFAKLRQMYNSFVLAIWFKEKLKESLFKYYFDSEKTDGIDLADKNIKEKVYNQYLKAYAKGVYNYIKSDYDITSRKHLKRKYYSGGITLTRDGIISSPLNTADLEKALNYCQVKLETTPQSHDFNELQRFTNRTNNWVELDKPMNERYVFDKTPENYLNAAYAALNNNFQFEPLITHKTDWFAKAHPSSLFHGLEHSCTRAINYYIFSRNRGFSKELSEFLYYVGILHDFDPNRTSNTRARVYFTLTILEKCMNNDFNGLAKNEQDILAALHGILTNKLNWQKKEYLMAMAIIARTEHPFDKEIIGKYYTTKGTTPVDQYHNLLNELKNNDNDMTTVQFIIQEAPLFSEFIDKASDFFIGNFSFAIYVSEQLVNEFETEGIKFTFGGFITRNPFILSLGIPAPNNTQHNDRLKYYNYYDLIIANTFQCKVNFLSISDALGFMPKIFVKNFQRIQHAFQQANMSYNIIGKDDLTDIAKSEVNISEAPPARDTPEAYVAAITTGEMSSSSPIFSEKQLISDGEQLGGIAFNKDFFRLDTKGNIKFDLPLEIIQKFKESSGLSFRILKIEQGVSLRDLLEKEDRELSHLPT